MDYVVAGFGIGAILALSGFALWELFGNVEEPGRSWLSRAAIGLMLGALVIWAVTGVSLISDIEDSMGSNLVLLTTLVTLIAVAGGTFWYWRADRALAVANPRPARVSAQREIAAIAAAPAASGDLELSEWDSWPERDAAKPEASESESAEPAPSPSFEPEVAVAAPVVDEVETDAPEIVDVEAVVVEETESVSDDEEPKEPVEVATDSVEPEEPVEAEAEFVEPEAELPSNVHPFRAPARPVAEPSEQVVEDDVLIAETVDVMRVDLPEEEDAAPVVVEEAEIVADVEEEQPSIVDDPGTDTDVVDEEDRPIIYD